MVYSIFLLLLDIKRPLQRGLKKTSAKRDQVAQIFRRVCGTGNIASISKSFGLDAAKETSGWSPQESSRSVQRSF